MLSNLIVTRVTSIIQEKIDIWIQTAYECTSDPSSTIIPLSADVTTVNISDKPVYPDVVSCLSPETLKKIHYMVEDPGFSVKSRMI